MMSDASEQTKAVVPPISTGEGGEIVARLWQELLEKDDRTSPQEYPDMALISFEEFRGCIADAIDALRRENEVLRSDAAQIDQERAETTRMLDRLASLMGLPDNEEVTQTKIEMFIDSLLRRVEQAERERDEADRAAGELRRRYDSLVESERKRDHWLFEAKQTEGFDSDTPFDDVWAKVRRERDEARAATEQVLATDWSPSMAVDEITFNTVMAVLRGKYRPAPDHSWGTPPEQKL